MKKYLIISIILLVGFFSCTNKSAFVLNVNLQNADGKTVYLQQKVDGVTANLDSALIENGTATLTTTIQTEPEMLYLFIDGMRRASSFFAENVEMQLTGDVLDLRSLKYSGSIAQDQYNAFNDSLRFYDQEIQKLAINYPQNASTPEEIALTDSLNVLYEKISGEQNKYTKDYITENNKSVVSHYIVLSNSYKYELEELEAIVDNFDKTVSSTFLDKLNDRVAILQKVAVGQPYVDFSMENPDGEQVSLSSLVGNSKLLLVDFWASWCGPCRGENPNVVAIYNDYHDKGFDVFGVSFDRQKENWLDAIEKDGLKWNHVSDLKFWDNAAGKLYGINSIPSSVLLDENGIIIAKNLRGDELRAKVEELLGK